MAILQRHGPTCLAILPLNPISDKQLSIGSAQNNPLGVFGKLHRVLLSMTVKGLAAGPQVIRWETSETNICHILLPKLHVHVGKWFHRQCCFAQEDKFLRYVAIWIRQRTACFSNCCMGDTSSSHESTVGTNFSSGHNARVPCSQAV